jgi:vacuolar-type H+-ATPase subunit I/STV1
MAERFAAANVLRSFEGATEMQVGFWDFVVFAVSVVGAMALSLWRLAVAQRKQVRAEFKEAHDAKIDALEQQKKACDERIGLLQEKLQDATERVESVSGDLLRCELNSNPEAREALERELEQEREAREEETAAKTERIDQLEKELAEAQEAVAAKEKRIRQLAKELDASPEDEQQLVEVALSSTGSPEPLPGEGWYQYAKRLVRQQHLSANAAPSDAALLPTYDTPERIGPEVARAESATIQSVPEPRDTRDAPDER